MEQILYIFHPTRFLNFHCLPAFFSWLFWDTSTTFVSQDEVWPWHSASPFLNLHVQATTKSLFFLTPKIFKLQYLLPVMEMADAFWRHCDWLKLSAGAPLPHHCIQLSWGDALEQPPITSAQHISWFARRLQWIHSCWNPNTSCHISKCCFLHSSSTAEPAVCHLLSYVFRLQTLWETVIFSHTVHSTV